MIRFQGQARKRRTQAEASRSLHLERHISEKRRREASDVINVDDDDVTVGNNNPEERRRQIDDVSDVTAVGDEAGRRELRLQLGKGRRQVDHRRRDVVVESSRRVRLRLGPDLVTKLVTEGLRHEQLRLTDQLAQEQQQVDH